MRPQLGLILLSLTAACAANARAGEPTANRPLFDRIGGKAGARCLASNLIDRLESNPRLMSNPRFRDVARSESKLKVKTRLAEWICKLTGGPCRPRHGLLDHVPVGIKASAVEWLAVVQEANRALDACRLSTREKGEMIALLINNRNS